MAVGRLVPLLLGIALAAPVVAPALAQPSSPHGVGSDGGPGGRWRARHGEMEGRRQADERQRSADVALLLRLRPDQRAGFQAWEASMRPSAGEDDPRQEPAGRLDQAPDAPRTTPQALDRMQARLAEREGRLRAHLEATRRLYASLSPEQQGLFDALMRLRHDESEGGARKGHGGPPMMRREGRETPGMAPPPGA